MRLLVITLFPKLKIPLQKSLIENKYRQKIHMISETPYLYHRETHLTILPIGIPTALLIRIYELSWFEAYISFW